MSGGSVAALFAESREQGWVGELDARFRLVGAFAFCCLLPALSSPTALALALSVAIAGVVAARIPPKAVMKRLAVVEGFMLALLLTMPFALPGQAVFSIFGLTATLEGMQRALAIAVRVNAAVLVITALLGGLGGQKLSEAMTGIGLPAVLAALLQMTMRYISTFGAEYRRLRTAMTVRGFRLRSNLHSWRSIGNLIGMLLVRSLERAENVHRAMLCRGYSGRFPAFATQPAPAMRDYGFAAALAGLMLGLVMLDILT